ncbi:MAG: 2-hydroxyacyl-CoA dehydratase, partial [Sphingomonadales bacterium]
YYPLDFNLASPYKKIPDAGWWKRLRSEWRDLVDPDQLALRVAEIERLIAHLEVLTGKRLEIGALSESLRLLNEQMDLVQGAMDAIATAPKCPVTLQDQLAMYQAMWHRGTVRGRDFAQAFHDETIERVAAGAQAYEVENYRLLYWSGDHEPRFHPYLREQHGAVFVANLYSASAQLYARDFDPADPLPALCGRNIFLVAHETPEWMLELAHRFRCDGIVVRERIYPRMSLDGLAAGEAGIPFLSVPHLNDGDDIRPILDAFIRDEVAPYAAARRAG